MSEAQKTKDHSTIRMWAEQRGGSPATVTATKDGTNAGLLRIDFPGYSGDETLEHIPWNDFFEKFDREDLTFLHQDKTDAGETSRFCKFVRDE